MARARSKLTRGAKLAFRPAGRPDPRLGRRSVHAPGTKRRFPLEHSSSVNSSLQTA